MIIFARSVTHHSQSVSMTISGSSDLRIGGMTGSQPRPYSNEKARRAARAKELVAGLVAASVG
jgi:hypothetical protein